jgi:CheY-like chemotaxis protein
MKEVKSKRLVYVIDDQITIASTLAEILRSEGYDAKFYTKPYEALDAALTRPPDLLLSDVIMPGMTGVELAIRVSRVWPECKVLLLSGNAGTVDLLKGASDRGHHFELLLKPLLPAVLLAKLKLVLTATVATD